MVVWRGYVIHNVGDLNGVSGYRSVIRWWDDQLMGCVYVSTKGERRGWWKGFDGGCLIVSGSLCTKFRV